MWMFLGQKEADKAPLTLPLWQRVQGVGQQRSDHLLFNSLGFNLVKAEGQWMSSGTLVLAWQRLSRKGWKFNQWPLPQQSHYHSLKHLVNRLKSDKSAECWKDHSTGQSSLWIFSENTSYFKSIPKWICCTQPLMRLHKQNNWAMTQTFSGDSQIGFMNLKLVSKLI